MTATAHTILGVFDEPSDAEQALTGLRGAGFAPDQISVVAQDPQDARPPDERHDPDGEGASTGAVTGGVFGGLAGLLVGISALVIPGIGPIVGSGILVAALAGAGIGAAAGGLVGALTAHGMPEEDARDYEAHVKDGRILLTVHAASAAQARAARDILNGSGGDTVRSYARAN